MDIKKRDQILFGSFNPDRYGPHKNFAPRFCDLTLDQVKTLVENGMLDPEMDQNGSPSTREFMEFMEEHPSARVAGFATFRSWDTNVVLTTVTLQTSDPMASATFASRFHDADEFDIHWDTKTSRFECRAWWD